MSRPRFPPEIFDHLIDLLRNNRGTLKQCCLVSKSWISRTRKHLFARIEFRSGPRFVEEDISGPYELTRTLAIDLREGNIEDDDWIRGFSCVKQLSLSAFHAIVSSFDPFYNLSSSLISLHLCSYFIHLRVFHFIRSLPLLEDLTLTGDGILRHGGSGGPRTVVQAPSTSPPHTMSVP